MKLWLKRFHWALWLVAAAAVGLVFFLLVPLFRTETKDGTLDSVDLLPRLPEALQNKLDEVHEEALEAKVEASVLAERDKKELESIHKVEDGKKRRAWLAEFVRGL